MSQLSQTFKEIGQYYNSDIVVQSSITEDECQYFLDIVKTKKD
ncbi:hypothetical protein [Tenacibaculum sp. 190524A02b]